jgi:hypothetical protein
MGSKSPHCPICHQELDTVGFLLQASEVFSEVGHKVKFACCGTVFFIETDSVEKWYKAIEGNKRTPPTHCEFCGRSIQGSKYKFYCNRACKQAAYRKRLKRKTLPSVSNAN